MKVYIIADSISPTGKRITTFQLKYQRFILAEVNTHRVLSKNSSSSRAIPVAKMIEQVRTDPAHPIHWGANQAGMQAAKELSGIDPMTGKLYLDIAKALWREAANSAADHAENLSSIGLHKQVANRILEPFQWMHTVLTGTEFENFYELRCHKDAQPEFQELACAMRDAQKASLPKQLFRNDWHLPYVMDSEESYPLEVKLKISTARCARVSYKTHDNQNPDLNKDIELHDRLVGGVPLHASPTEHQAQCKADNSNYKNFVGWQQYRHTVESNIHLLGAK